VLTKAKAIILGALVFIATLFTCVCLATPVVIMCVCDFEDHGRRDPNWDVPALLAVASLVFSLRAGRMVSRDWYRAGRDAAR
jgi:hypothetical protein